MEAWFNAVWYGNNHPFRWVLYPFSIVFRSVSALRRNYLVRYRQRHHRVPVIVVGNISIGGVGKTPLIIELARRLSAQGQRVGIVSRGYKSNSAYYPRLVSNADCAYEVGDEPLLIAKKTACPVVISSHRCDAVEYLQQQCHVDVILSDDGLQHYAMGRQMEIAVVDALRGLGNGMCLPAGPLRESPKRLQQVDMVIMNGGLDMSLEVEGIYQLKTQQKICPSSLKAPIIAMAGIGNPGRFYQSLRSCGVSFETRSYPDHYHYKTADFKGLEKHTIIMTEKDAMKCGNCSPENSYYLSVNARISDALWDRFTVTLQEKLK